MTSAGCFGFMKRAAGSSTGLPVFRSISFAQFTGTNGFAEISWPLVRSMT